MEDDIKRVKTLSEFLDEDLSNYAFYQVLTQIPHSLDGMTVTQRKIAYVMGPILKGKKIKTAQTYSYLLNETNYVHGDMSVYNTANNMAAKYKNNINILTPYADFGSRTVQEASAPRYTELKFSKISELLFPKVDFNIIENQTFEGQEIEPYYMAPVLPLALINGNSGIAMGYSSSILPRNPLEILDIISGILKKEITTINTRISPYLPYFKGTIEEGNNPTQWVFKGVISKIKSTKATGVLQIHEIPFMSREKYIEKTITPLIENGTIKSWTDDCSKNSFFFEIKVPVEIYEKSEEELLDIFGLVQTKSETLTFLDRDSDNIDILEYNNIASYLKDWIFKRIDVYRKRKQYIESKLEFEINKIQNRIRFIEMIIDDDIIIKERKKKEIESDLVRFNFDKIEDSFDYLLSMSLWNLTEDKIKENTKKLKELEKELRNFKKKTLVDLWLEDLDEIRELIEKEVQEKAL